MMFRLRVLTDLTDNEDEDEMRVKRKRKRKNEDVVGDNDDVGEQTEQVK